MLKKKLQYSRWGFREGRSGYCKRNFFFFFHLIRTVLKKGEILGLMMMIWLNQKS